MEITACPGQVKIMVDRQIILACKNTAGQVDILDTFPKDRQNISVISTPGGGVSNKPPWALGSDKTQGQSVQRWTSPDKDGTNTGPI